MNEADITGTDFTTLPRRTSKPTGMVCVQLDESKLFGGTQKNQDQGDEGYEKDEEIVKIQELIDSDDDSDDDIPKAPVRRRVADTEIE